MGKERHRRRKRVEDRAERGEGRGEKSCAGTGMTTLLSDLKNIYHMGSGVTYVYHGGAKPSLSWSMKKPHTGRPWPQCKDTKPEPRM